MPLAKDGTTERRMLERPLDNPQPAETQSKPAVLHLAPFLQPGHFHSWLLEVAPGGELTRYSEALQDAFDDVQQIVEIYSASGAFDPCFFEDVGVSDYAHQCDFEAWFVSRCGLSSSVAAQEDDIDWCLT